MKERRAILFIDSHWWWLHNKLYYLSSACHCVKKWGTVQKTQWESLSFEWTLLSRVDLFKPACTLMIVVHLIFRHSFGCSLCLFWDSRGNNCFYFFIFNPCSINTPGYMTHQPLAIPHKETGLFGATTIWFWGGAVWFHSFPPLLTGAFQGRLWAALHNAVRRALVRTEGKGKKRKRKLPSSKLAEKRFLKVIHHPHIPFKWSKPYKRSWKERRGKGEPGRIGSSLYCKFCWIRQGLGLLLLILEDF